MDFQFLPIIRYLCCKKQEIRFFMRKLDGRKFISYN